MEAQVQGLLALGLGLRLNVSWVATPIEHERFDLEILQARTNLMGLGRVVWRLARWYTSQPTPPFSIETFASMLKIINSNKKDYRLPWDVDADLIQSNMGSFLKHLQITLGKEIEGLGWVFYPVIEATCPKCHTLQKFVYAPYVDEFEVDCPNVDCEAYIKIKALGIKRIPSAKFPPELHVQS